MATTAHRLTDNDLTTTELDRLRTIRRELRELGPAYRELRSELAAEVDAIMTAARTRIAR